jgi:glutamate/tyrosine decarboxylase-like PLP-dependent enzyme
MFEGLVETHPMLEITVPRSLSLVCFHHVDGDDATKRMLEGCNRTGRMFMSHTRLGERYVARMSIGQSRVDRHHVESAWKIIDEQARNARNA